MALAMASEKASGHIPWCNEIHPVATANCQLVMNPLVRLRASQDQLLHGTAAIDKGAEGPAWVPLT